MPDERRIFAALAVILFTYVFLTLIALMARGPPLHIVLRRWWRRFSARRDRDH